MENRSQILKFIEDFKQYDKDGTLEKTFLNGYCYWFAYMLDGRFLNARIQYEPIEGHFVTEIDGRYYDIRGDVTDIYKESKVWYSEDYCFEFDSIVNGCIMKTDGAGFTCRDGDMHTDKELNEFIWNYV